MDQVLTMSWLLHPLYVSLLFHQHNAVRCVDSEFPVTGAIEARLRSVSRGRMKALHHSAGEQSGQFLRHFFISIFFKDIIHIP